MSIINEALKKAKRERESVAYTLHPEDIRKSLDLEYSGRKFEMNWGPFFVILVLVLITGPIVFPIFSTPFRKTSSSAKISPAASHEVLPLENLAQGRMALPAGQILSTRKAQFSVEEAPIFHQAIPSPADRPLLTLSGIVYAAGKNSYCLLNDKVVTAGETIQGAKVVSIHSDKVTVEYQGENIVLTLPR